MVIRGTPKDLQKYIKVEYLISPIVSQRTKQRPVYMDNNYVYYKRTSVIESVVKEYE
jgi:hypothetical protein